jgi:hypothetical protein
MVTTVMVTLLTSELTLLFSDTPTAVRRLDFAELLIILFP